MRCFLKNKNKIRTIHIHIILGTATQNHLFPIFLTLLNFDLKSLQIIFNSFPFTNMTFTFDNFSFSMALRTNLLYLLHETRPYLLSLKIHSSSITLIAVLDIRRVFGSTASTMATNRIFG